MHLVLGVFGAQHLSEKSDVRWGEGGIKVKVGTVQKKEYVVIETVFPHNRYLLFLSFFLSPIQQHR